MGDDVEKTPDGRFLFDNLDFYADGSSIMSWSPLVPRGESPVASPKKRTSTKVAGTPPRPRNPREVAGTPPRPRNPCEVEAMTPLKLGEKQRDMTSKCLFKTEVCVVMNGVRGPPLYVHLPQKKTSS
jgi:hypothetical protein